MGHHAKTSVKPKPVGNRMSNIRLSLALSFAQRNSGLVIQFVSSMIIARLLTPHEIGIFSIGAVVVSFSHIVRDMGVSNYLIQERELTIDRIRSAQAIAWITSWTICLILVLLSSWAGEFYAEPGVTLTMRVLAGNFLLLPIGVVTIAMLSREMRFERLFAINICSTLAQALTGILLAWSGFGFISLAWSAVAGTSVSVFGSVLCRRRGQPWLPSLREWRKVFGAGAKLSATSMFYEIGLGGPELVTGRILGLETMAYFSRGFGAAMIIYRTLVESVMPVAIPYFSSQSRSEQDMKLPYLRGIACMSGLAVPAFACMGVMADPIIFLLYGGQWLEASKPLQIVSGGLACLAVTNVAGSVLIGSGEFGKILRMHSIFQPCKVLMAAVGGGFFGIKGVAAGVAIGDIGLSISCFMMANQRLGVSLSEFIYAILSSIGVTLGTALVPWVALMVTGGLEHSLSRTMITIAASSCCWVLTLFLTRHPLWQELCRAFLR